MKTLLFYLWRSPLQFLIRKYVLNRAWLDGYLLACVEIKRERALMLSALDRLNSTRTTTFFASKPSLPFIATELLDAWDDGYERAVTMHRLGFKPSGGPRVGAKLAQRAFFPGFDDYIKVALDGEVSRDPRVWCTKNGTSLYARHRYQALERLLYEDYRQKLRIMRAAHIQFVDDECAECAAQHPEDCTCNQSAVHVINRKKVAC